MTDLGSPAAQFFCPSSSKKLPPAPSSPQETFPWRYCPNVIPPALGEKLYDILIKETIDLQLKPTLVWNNPGKESRLTQFYSTSGHTFKYSGVTHASSKRISDIALFEDLIQAVNAVMKEEKLPSLEECCNPPPFNAILVNHYRAKHLADQVRPHSDTDGRDHIIASVNLGAPRMFEIFRKPLPGEKMSKPKHRVGEPFVVEPNSILFMLPEMQQHFLHGTLPVTKKMLMTYPTMADARINVTLRTH